MSEVPECTNENPEAGLLEDVDVVVVGVPHGPPQITTINNCNQSQGTMKNRDKKKN